MKNYLIVGGSSGIGRELVQLLASAGHQVYATYCQHPVQDDSPQVAYHPLDVTAPELDLQFLPARLDGFVYCPGSINLVPFARLKPDDFTQDFQLQVTGAIQVMQAILPRLKAAETASVVFFSTVAVQLGFSFHSQVAVSKGALEGLTRALAAELAPSIRVNAVAPSITDTPLAAKYLNSEEKKKANAQRHPLKTIGTPRHIADMAAFLLSDQAAWVTGQVLHVDGGMSRIKLY
ncbi:SDR family oxidoreductase [Rhabdobacter roseus]|uniref:NAD(P)-dependent dehydrogenase (Short-subunit alcohol dehydrogenase family) n=1 Tax=Rhabdobacter roseus TaxID=1655419 RepID=A0A840TLH9_9BACT|nr:SDR family oxidoreductase [Rhabdobacter roseus]MBB5285066.1 NAD(P)-dependent dehydrogenase (short-subunit alcohol dehydrogenase family) [Rhabdobacter roseus]